MTFWQIMPLLIMPIGGLLIAAALAYVVDRDAKREDQRNPAE